jgi:hypothetical protein
MEAMLTLYARDGAVPASAVGEILRAAGCYPPEDILTQQWLPELVGDDSADSKDGEEGSVGGAVDVAKLRKFAAQHVASGDFTPEPAPMVLDMLRSIDRALHDGREVGFIEADRLQKQLMNVGGVPFSSTECKVRRPRCR